MVFPISQLFGKASSSQTPSTNKRLFGSSVSVDCQSVFHLRTSFPRDMRNEMSFSQNSMPSTLSSSCSALFTVINGTRQSRWRALRSSSDDNEGVEKRNYSLLVMIDWTRTYIITYHNIFGKG